MWSKPILNWKGSKYGKTKKVHSYSLWLLYLNADWYLSKHCRLTIFSWASFPILDFLDQQEKFATSATCVTTLTLATKAAFIHKILCFEVFSVNWLTECSKIKSFMNAKTYRAYIVFLTLPIKNGPLPTELKFKESTVFPHLFSGKSCILLFFHLFPRFLFCFQKQWNKNK